MLKYVSLEANTIEYRVSDPVAPLSKIWERRSRLYIGRGPKKYVCVMCYVRAVSRAKIKVKDKLCLFAHDDVLGRLAI
jgi:hypothetical protein